ncbi:hypothetical protein BC835DRAFT_1412129 [Cytidiella melzeri]|nr:hypothetical protein BC835DRAFT_1412129 [Cytidiella melzeri]
MSTPLLQPPPPPPWINVRPMNKSRKQKVDVPRYFRVDADVRAAMEHHLEEVGPDEQRFTYNTTEQDQVYELVDSLGIHIPGFSLRDAVSKFAVVNTNINNVNSRLKDHSEKFVHILRYYICGCAIDHTVAGKKGPAKKRWIAWENVGCMAWAKLTTTHQQSSESTALDLLAIDELVGIFSHSPSCRATTQTIIIPRVPLHPALRQFALNLLRRHVPLTQVQMERRAYAKRQWGSSVGDENYCYRFSPRETTSLYRTLQAENSIPQGSLAEDNLDKWFRSLSPQPPTTQLTDLLIHYQPHIQGKTARFELALSTPEQQVMAWKYGHKNVVVMDGTFGVCSVRVLLFILMVVDNSNRGIPVAFFLFTAKEKHTAVHASYDSTVLEKFLFQFRAAMGKNDLGEDFEFAVGMTDINPREHRALRSQWPSMFLMMCLFHMSQAWRNTLNKHLYVIPKGNPRKQVHKRLGKAQGALLFLIYLQDYLKERAFWRSWSAASAEEASAHLHIPANTVICTTNHLKSFNGRLKHKYFQLYLKCGRLPRIDVYVLMLVKEVVPFILKEREERDSMNSYRSAMTFTPETQPHQEPVVKAQRNVLPEPDLQILEEDEERDAEEETTVCEFEDNTGGYACVLEVLDNNGGPVVSANKFPNTKMNTRHRVPSDIPSDNSWEILSEHALDTDNILRAVNPERSIEFPFALAQEDQHSDSSILADLREEDTNLETQRSIAWQQLILAQDLSAKYIKELVQLGVSEKVLQEHMSVAIANCIQKPPAQLIQTDDSAQKRRRIGSLPLDDRVHKQTRFNRQLKEACKESHGIR